jgi:hypothetical protein
VNPVATKYGAAPLASVNLVPKDVQDRRKLRAVQFTAGLAVLLAIGAVVLGFLVALGAQAAANSSLADAVARQDAAIAERDAKAPVYDAYVSREEQEFALSQAGFGEINMSQYVMAIGNTAADGKTNFVEIKVHGPSALGFGGSEPDALFGTGVGTIEFTARSVSAIEASRFIARLEAVPGVASVKAVTEEYFDEGGTVYWEIRGTALVTQNVLTMRIIPTETVTGLDALTLVRTQDTDTPGVAPTPEPSASPSASPSPSSSPSAESES